MCQPRKKGSPAVEQHAKKGKSGFKPARKQEIRQKKKHVSKFRKWFPDACGAALK